MKRKRIVDLWVLFLIFALIPANIGVDFSDREDYHIKDTSDNHEGFRIGVYMLFNTILLTMVVLSLVLLFVLYRCGRIKKYRYLILHSECKRVSSFMKKILRIGMFVGMGMSMFLLMYFAYISLILGIPIIFTNIIKVIVLIFLTVHITSTDATVYEDL